jgi:formylglycine-generating enzyme required for sulfatase activity
LSFVFASQLGTSTSPERSIRLLGRLIEQGLVPSRQRTTEEWLGLALVVADCLQVLHGRKIRLQERLTEEFRQTCLSAIEQEVPVQERRMLGLALGHLGDPRVTLDLRARAGYVEIPTGNYLLGEERKPFRLEKSFLLARFPVTNSQYGLFIEEKGYENPAWWSKEGWAWLGRARVNEPTYWRSVKWNGPNQPVVGVSVWEAEAFCAWAGGRLPGEHEWEAAAHGPKGLAYPWGDVWQDGICNVRETGLGVTTPVGLFPRAQSKALGLQDMAGNMSEWCADLYETNDERNLRVVRGGSWGDLLNRRPAFRMFAVPEHRYEDVGFRVASRAPQDS